MNSAPSIGLGHSGTKPRLKFFSIADVRLYTDGRACAGKVVIIDGCGNVVGRPDVCGVGGKPVIVGRPVVCGVSDEPTVIDVPSAMR